MGAMRTRVWSLLAAASLFGGVALAVVVVTPGVAGAVTIPGIAQTEGVSCPTASFCVAVGTNSSSTNAAAVSTNGGSTWTTTPIGAGSWNAVSCVSASNCTAGGYSQTGALVASTSDGATTWKQVFSAPGASISGVSCVGTSCLGVGYLGTAAFAAATTGGAWAAVASPAGATILLRDSCVTATQCWATGKVANGVDAVFATGDGGHTWSTESLPPFSGQPSQQDVPGTIDFVDATHGFVVFNGGGCGGPGCSSRIGPGGGIEATSDGGAHWTVQQDISNGVGSNAISCVDDLHCLVAGAETAGEVNQVTSNGGATWTQAGSPTAGQDPTGVACPTGGSCVVVGFIVPSGSGADVSFADVVGGPGGTPSCTAQASSPAPTGIVSRIAGSERDATAIAVSQASYPSVGSASAVVLASDANYPDALAGTPLAVAKKAPLLLTPPTGLSQEVAVEISRVAPKGSTVYILGGTSALASAVDTEVQGLGDTPQRIAGVNRQSTAVDIAGALGDPKTILEATGFNFPDALSAGAAAAKAGGAVLLTVGSTQAAETAAYLQAHPGDTTTAIGGPAATADPKATAIAGADRFATAVMVAQHFFNAPPVVGFASGVAFPDALSGGADAGKGGGPIVLVLPCGPLPSSVSTYLSSVKGPVKSGTLFGGTSAVGDDVLAELEAAA